MEVGFYRELENGRLQCELCPRECRIPDGKKGFCSVRENRHGKMVLSTYGQTGSMAIDPIEKKPLNHFLPTSSVLSFGTPGCNLACKHCQNWTLSRAREMSPHTRHLSPAEIATTARQHGAASVAFTYNDPVIFAEFAVDTAIACHREAVRTVAVTAGYISSQARPFFFEHMDAANVDLKSIRPEFYEKQTSSQLQPVLETLIFLRNQTQTWLEITNLLIPGQNDSRDDIIDLCHWILDHLGPEVPLHFTAFHPNFKMNYLPRTPDETLMGARQIAHEVGIKFVYLGNCRIPGSQDTVCPECSHLLISRSGYETVPLGLDPNGLCDKCSTPIAGIWN